MRQTRLLALSLLSLLAPLRSFAQTSEIVTEDLSRGLTQPPTSAALTNQVTAIAVNPAGLSHVGGLELGYLHERNNTLLETGDGVYLGGTFFELLGAGVSVEWLRGAEASRRRTTWGASLGGQAMSLGFSYSYFAAPEIPELSPQKSWTLGIEGRPSRYLAYGLVVRNIDEPSRGSLTLPRTWNVALASRPVGDDYEVAVDYLFQDSQGVGAGLGSGRLTYTVQAGLLPGLTLGGGVSHGLNAGDPLALQLSLTLDASHLGATYALGGGPDGLDHLVGVRLSQRKYPSIVPGQKTVALFDLDELLTPETSIALTVMGVSAADPYLKFTELLDGAIRDPTLGGVILKVNPVGLGLGRAEELRQGIFRLRSSGKKVMALLLSV
ncbi:MAG: Clp protease/crotonase-like domain-containing protein, partial [Myxococcaceae bacterium]